MSQFLMFKLATDKNGWPPAGAESIPVERVTGGYRVLTPPFFVKDISVGDIVDCSNDSEGYVSNLVCKHRSARSTIWVAPRGAPPWQTAKAELLGLGCNVETLKEFGVSSIDLPENVSLALLDRILEPVASAGAFVAYPSLRHVEGGS